jgi:hypothetical protein
MTSLFHGTLPDYLPVTAMNVSIAKNGFCNRDEMTSLTIRGWIIWYPGAGTHLLELKSEPGPDYPGPVAYFRA